jgi:hypothetical protein
MSRVFFVLLLLTLLKLFFVYAHRRDERFGFIVEFTLYRRLCVMHCLETLWRILAIFSAQKVISILAWQNHLTDKCEVKIY